MRIILSIIFIFSYFANAAEIKSENELEQQLEESLKLADNYSNSENYNLAFDHYENAIIIAQSLPGELHFFVYFKASYAAYNCEFYNEAADFFAQMIDGLRSQQFDDTATKKYIKKLAPPSFLDEVWAAFDANNQDGRWNNELVWLEAIQGDTMILD